MVTEDNQYRAAGLAFELLQLRRDGVHRNQFAACDPGDLMLERLANVNQMQSFAGIQAALDIIHGGFQGKLHLRSLLYAALLVCDTVIHKSASAADQRAYTGSFPAARQCTDGRTHSAASQHDGGRILLRALCNYGSGTVTGNNPLRPAVNELTIAPSAGVYVANNHWTACIREVSMV